MQPKDAKDLLKKYREGTATEAEKDLLGDWVLFGKLKALDLTDEDLEQELALLDAGSPLYRTKVVRLWPRIVAAASILIFLSVGGYFLLNKQSDQQLVKIKMHDIAPGSNKAILTLANGKQIILNDAQNGKLVQQGNAAITKTQNGQIVYQAADKGAATDMAYNTTTTPRGGEYHITLADGTNVWLNAASSITYPTTFNGNDRTVQITGEVYFEVAHNAAKPFRVKSNGQTIEVLGTHFNINSYDEEGETKTTLLKGSVKVSGSAGSRVLKPGQQADLSAKGISVKDVEVEDAVAWKNGYFMFDSEKLESIMNRIARWYNVELIYEDPELKKETFFGRVSRSEYIGKVLNTLEGTDVVKFEVEGNVIKIKRK